MRKYLVLITLVLSGCQTAYVQPASFVKAPIHAGGYDITAWAKLRDDQSPVRIYLEGDGHSYSATGRPSADPTPKGTFWREIAFNDPNPNVAYLARPCQFGLSPACTVSDWTDGRFSASLVTAMTEAVERIASGRDVVLIGYSGGALLSGLIIERTSSRVVQWITVAGLLDHEAWTRQAGLAPLSKSMNLKPLPKVRQIHYFGTDDRVIDQTLFQNVPCAVPVDGAGHAEGWESTAADIYKLSISDGGCFQQQPAMPVGRLD